MPRGEPGKPKSAEHRAKTAEAARGRVVSQETRAKLSAMRRGVPKTEAHKAAISAALKGQAKTERIDYYLAHGRMGDASQHLCICGERAKDWAYQYTCEKPFFSSKGWPYSTNTEDYLPMCRRCHKKMDCNR